jgi:hypothetical protein
MSHYRSVPSDAVLPHMVRDARGVEAGVPPALHTQFLTVFPDYVDKRYQTTRAVGAKVSAHAS